MSTHRGHALRAFIVKEVRHILRDRQTLFMTMFFPFVELLMLGYAVDTKVTNIPTVIYDQANTQLLVDHYGNILTRQGKRPGKLSARK